MQIVKTREDLRNLKVEQVTITNVSEIKTENTRSDGKPSRQYITVKVTEHGNVLDSGLKATKNIFQDYDSTGNPVWSINPANIVEGVVTNGTIINFETKPYFIPSENGKEEVDGKRGNWVNNYTTLALPSEIGNETKIMGLVNNAGREFVENNSEPVTIATRVTAKVTEPIEN